MRLQREVLKYTKSCVWPRIRFNDIVKSPCDVSIGCIRRFLCLCLRRMDLQHPPRALPVSLSLLWAVCPTRLAGEQGTTHINPGRVVNSGEIYYQRSYCVLLCPTLGVMELTGASNFLLEQRIAKFLLLQVRGYAAEYTLSPAETEPFKHCVCCSKEAGLFS